MPLVIGIKIYIYLVLLYLRPTLSSATGKQSIKRLLLLLGIVSSFLLMVSCVLFSSWLVLGDAQTREKKMCHTFCSDGFQIPKRLILLPHHLEEEEQDKKNHHVKRIHFYTC